MSFINTVILVPRTGHIIDYGGAFDSMQQIGPFGAARRRPCASVAHPPGPDDLDAAIAPVPVGDNRKVDLRSLRVYNAAASRHLTRLRFVRFM
jgi:amidase